MSFLLDTNVLSAMRRPSRLEPKVRKWLEGVRSRDLYISAITLMEIEIGVLRMERIVASQGAAMRTWKEEWVARAFAGRILPIDVRTAECCATLHVPDPSPPMDSLIGATAILHHMTLVTRNVRDFRSMPVRIFDPWATSA